MTRLRAGWQGWGIAALAAIALAAILVIRAMDDAPDDPAGTQEVPEVGRAGGVPSGQPVTLMEAIFEPQADGQEWLRLRFVAPRIGEGAGMLDFDTVEPDMAHLCREVGLPAVAQSGRPVALIVVSLSQRETVFGESHPDVTQYFEAYRPADDACIWEGLL